MKKKVTENKRVGTLSGSLRLVDTFGGRREVFREIGPCNSIKALHDELIELAYEIRIQHNIGEYLGRV